MPQDAFHIRRLSKELNETLTGGKINRISAVSKDELTFIIYTKKSTLKLIVSSNASFARAVLSKTEKDPLAVPTNFCMLLRKHLVGGEILSVSQHDFERIIKMDIRCENDFSSKTRTLYIELMGKYSNVLLVEDDVILGAQKMGSLEDGKRALFAGAKYVFPALQDKVSPFDLPSLSRAYDEYFSFKEKSVDTLTNFFFEKVQGIAPSTAYEMAKRLFSSPLSDVSSFCKDEPISPCLVYEKGSVKDFFAFPVANGVPVSDFLTCEALYFEKKESERTFSEKKLKLENCVKAYKKKLEKNLRQTNEKLADAETGDDDKLKGELLTANLYKLKFGQEVCEVENYYLSPPAPVKIALDKTLSPNRNAQRYFKLYQKKKRTKDALLPRKAQEEAELNYAESISFSVSKAENLIDLADVETELISLSLLKEQPKKKKQVKDLPFRSYSIGGFSVFVGRNNVQNDLLCKSADPTDLWLHTKLFHSAHVLIKTEKRTVPDFVLLFSAELCAYYSDAKGGEKVAVDYCQKKFVKKPPKAKPGAVVYTDYKTVVVNADAHQDSRVE